ncbi:MAG: hypothetical protein IKV03_02005 [Alphaproteobacteria bacterium]|nr:hypothetical protein [Alphaproteobacteria bacterium]
MTEEKKQLFHDLMTLDKVVFVPKYASKLKKYVKSIYLILLVFLTLFALVGLVNLFSAKISAALVQFIFVFVGFIVVRMFCEFLMTYEK